MFQGNPVSTCPRSHSAPASAKASSDERRPTPGRQNARAATVASDQNKREPRRHERHRERQRPAELVGLDEECFADPEQAGEKEAETEPPAVEGRAPQAFAAALRHLAAPSMSQTRTGKVRNRTGQKKKGAKREHRNRTGAERNRRPRSPSAFDTEARSAPNGPGPASRDAVMIGAHKAYSRIRRRRHRPRPGAARGS